MAKINMMSDEEFEAAILAGKYAAPHMIRGLSVQYFAEEDVFYFTFVNHEPVVVPRLWVQGLEHVSKSEASACEIVGSGVSWPAIDVDHSIEGIAHGRYGNQRWMRELDKRRATAAQEQKSDKVLA